MSPLRTIDFDPTQAESWKIEHFILLSLPLTETIRLQVSEDVCKLITENNLSPHWITAQGKISFTFEEFMKYIEDNYPFFPNQKGILLALSLMAMREYREEVDSQDVENHTSPKLNYGFSPAIKIGETQIRAKKNVSSADGIQSKVLKKYGEALVKFFPVEKDKAA